MPADGQDAAARRRTTPPHHETASIAGSGPAAHVVVPLGQRQEKRSEQVARLILHEISSRALGPGTILPAEALMCATYGVGRPTLREALRILEVNGLIAMKPGPGGGPQVLDPSPAALARMSTLHFQALGVRMKDLALARASIEGTLAALAAESADAEGLARLAAGLADAAGGRSQSDVLDAAYDFHTSVMLLAPNPVLRQMGLALQDMLNARLGHVHPPESLEEVQADHRAIVDAILARDPAAAERAMAEHWRHTLQVPTLQQAGDLPVEWI